MTHTATGLGNQNAIQHNFAPPNGVCAAQCVLDIFNYGACYNACVNNQPSVVVTTGGGSANPVTSTDVSSSKPVVSPGTNRTTTSGTGVEPTGVPQTGGNFGTTSTSGTPTSTAASTSPFGTASWQDFGIRAGLVVGGSILIIVGVIKIFSGQPVIQSVPGTLPRRAPTPPVVERRSFVETRDISRPPTVNKTPNVAAAAAGAP